MARHTKKWLKAIYIILTAILVFGMVAFSFV